MGNLIDIRKRLKSQKLERSSQEASSESNAASITDISELREQMIQSERRIAKRVILNGFIGAHVVVPGRGLSKVSLYDISKSGVSFDLPREAGHFREREEVAMRFYFNHSVYFGFTVQVTMTREIPEDATYRHGALIARDSFNQAAIVHFVEFLENVSASLRTDKGDVCVSGLGM